MKRISSFLFVLLLVFQCTLPAYALENNIQALPETMIGYATDSNRQVHEITGYLVETQTPFTFNGTYSATYAYDVSMTSTADAPDSGFASHVYLTVYYKVRDGQYYLLTRVSGYWEIQDYNVIVTNAQVEYVCGPYGGCDPINVSNNFNLYTGYTDYTEDDGSMSQVKAKLTLTYQMGSSRTWTFTLNNSVL